MARFGTRKLALAVLTCCAFAALALSSFAGADQPGDESFAGVCEMSGVIRHQPPLTQEPATAEAHGSFSGTCSGELTDRHGRTHQLDGARARYEARAAGELSCLGGTATGFGRLIFGHGRVIDFSLTERRGPGTAVVTLEGAAGGSAIVLGTVSQSEDPAELNERCNGPGLRSVRGDARIESPGISG